MVALTVNICPFAFALLFEVVLKLRATQSDGQVFGASSRSQTKLPHISPGVRDNVGGVLGGRVGIIVGCLVGGAVGFFDGCIVGDVVGFSVGPMVGELVGGKVGSSVGFMLGERVGAIVGSGVDSVPNTISTLAYAGLALALISCTLTTKSNPELLQLMIVSCSPA